MSIELEIPSYGRLDLRYLVLDLNGTLAVDGILLPGVADRIECLKDTLEIYLVTSDTHGTGSRTARELGIRFRRLEREYGSDQKEKFVRELGARETVAIGNGRNDVGMLRAAALGIAVVGGEGAASAALLAADLVTKGPADALDLLLFPKRLVASLRG